MAESAVRDFVGVRSRFLTSMSRMYAARCSEMQMHVDKVNTKLKSAGMSPVDTAPLQLPQPRRPKGKHLVFDEV